MYCVSGFIPERNNMMSYKDNIESILQCNIPQVKDEIIEIISRNICRLATPEMNNYCEGYFDGLNLGNELAKEDFCKFKEKLKLYMIAEPERMQYKINMEDFERMCSDFLTKGV